MFIFPFITSFSIKTEKTSAFRFKTKRSENNFWNNFIVKPFIVVLQLYNKKLGKNKMIIYIHGFRFSGFGLKPQNLKYILKMK